MSFLGFFLKHSGGNNSMWKFFFFLTFFLAHQISVYIVNNHFKLLCQEKPLLPNWLPRLIKHLCATGNSLLYWYGNSQWYFLAVIFYTHWCSLPSIFTSSSSKIKGYVLAIRFLVGSLQVLLSGFSLCLYHTHTHTYACMHVHTHRL